MRDDAEFDDALDAMLAEFVVSEMPQASKDFWGAVDARLEAASVDRGTVAGGGVESELDTRGEVVRLRSMTEKSNYSRPAIAMRLAVAAAVIVALVGALTLLPRRDSDTTGPAAANTTSTSQQDPSTTTEVNDTTTSTTSTTTTSTTGAPPAVRLGELDGNTLAIAGFEAIGCWFSQSNEQLPILFVHFSGDEGAAMVDGVLYPLVPDSSTDPQIGIASRYVGGGYAFDFTDVGEAQNDFESTEWAARLNVSSIETGAEVLSLGGILWCGV